jgi:hypothetical protein
MKKLETENGKFFSDVTREILSSAVTSLNATDNTFVILEMDDGSLIQAAYNGKKGFYVELQNSKTKDRMICNKNISDIDDVISLFIEFDSNAGLIAPPHWKKEKMQATYSNKLYQNLSYIGLALIAVSFFFIMTKNFDHNLFAKFIMIIGMWLMVPGALIDTAKLSGLRRGIINFDALRAPVIILCAVSCTLLLIFK